MMQHHLTAKMEWGQGRNMHILQKETKKRFIAKTEDTL